ncbi:MAG: DUF2283 domain-containing protein [Rhodothermales bacterium]|nr:DUF2283 domain-containing protein [Rhodothermales bacterium]
MRVEFFPDTDTLSILFLAPGTVAGNGVDTADPDVTLYYDDEQRIAEIAIEHVSARVDLAELRRRVSFEEVHSGDGAAPGVSAAA